MKLSNNWFTEGIVDFEHKKYLLLAYLKSVSTQFNEVKLYPDLSELIAHLRNLQAFYENKELLASQFPKQFTGVDMQLLKLNYKKMLADDDVLLEIENIINYALPRMSTLAKQGTEIYDFLEKKIVLEPVGIEPIYRKEGYMLISDETERTVRIYRYKWHFFTSDENKFVGLQTNYLFSELRSWVSNIEQLKRKLINRYADLPNPATYRFHSQLSLPIQETYLPLARRLLMRRLAV